MEQQWLKPKTAFNFYKPNINYYIFSANIKSSVHVTVIPMEVTQEYVCDKYIHDEDQELIDIFFKKN